MAPALLFSCDYIYVKLYFHCFISRKYAFTDFLQNRCLWKFRKIYRKTSVTDSLDSATDVCLRIFKVFSNTSERLHLISIQSSYCFKTFLFQNRSIFVFNISSYFRVYKHLWSLGPLGPHTFFTLNGYYWGKNYTCIKKVHDIYFVKHIKHFAKRSRVLNMLGFWIYLWFWIC